MTGQDYDLLLHCTIGHMHRVEPDFEDGECRTWLWRWRKDAELACSTRNTQVHILHFYHVLHILHIDVSICRHTLRETQPIYGFWLYFMIHHCIGHSLSTRSCPDSFPDPTLKSMRCWIARSACIWNNMQENMQNMDELENMHEYAEYI